VYQGSGTQDAGGLLGDAAIDWLSFFDLDSQNYGMLLEPGCEAGSSAPQQLLIPEGWMDDMRVGSHGDIADYNIGRSYKKGPS
jgi:hypothetical protein